MLLLADFPDSTYSLTITTIILNIRRTLAGYNTLLQASLLISPISVMPVTYVYMWFKEKFWLYFLIKCPGHIKIFTCALNLKPGQWFLFFHLKVLFPIMVNCWFSLLYLWEALVSTIPLYLQNLWFIQEKWKEKECATIKRTQIKWIVLYYYYIWTTYWTTC